MFHHFLRETWAGRVLVLAPKLMLILVLAGFIAVAASLNLKGDVLAFTANVYDYGGLATHNIFIMDVDKKLTYNLTNHSSYDSYLMWSPNGAYLAFFSQENRNECCTGEGYVIHLGRSDVIQVTQNLARAFIYDWSANSSNLLVVSPNELYTSRIYQINVQSLNIDLVNETDGGLDAIWSPDGNQIAFIRQPSTGVTGIFLMNSDGTNLYQLTHLNFFIGSLSWSSDGRKLLFAGSDDIFTVEITNGNITRLTDNIAYNNSPVWSPDSSQIVFVSNMGMGGIRTIYLMNSDGSNVRPLLNDLPNQDYFAPQWSPDGTRIAFTNGEGIYISDSEGQNFRRIAVGSGYAYVSWRPR